MLSLAAGCHVNSQRTSTDNSLLHSLNRLTACGWPQFTYWKMWWRHMLLFAPPLQISAGRSKCQSSQSCPWKEKCLSPKCCNYRILILTFSCLWNGASTVRTTDGSVSVFQVGIGFSVYRSVFFSSRFGICCRYFKISRYRFGIFGISLCVKAPCADPKLHFSEL